MNKTTKKLAISLSMVILALGLTACGKSADDSAAAAPLEANSPSSTPTPTQNEVSSPSALPVSELFQATGTFVGLADSHTVEIKVIDESVSYQLGEGMDKDFEGVKPGDLVTFDYIQKPIDGSTNKELVITNISLW